MLKPQKAMTKEPSGTTLYAKEGNRYVPVSEHYTFDYYRNGTYLVIVRPGCRSLCTMLRPAIPEVEAALKIAGEGMLNAMMNARNSPRKPERLTPAQVKAFKAWTEAFETDCVTLPSGQEIIEAGLAELRRYIEDTRNS